MRWRTIALGGWGLIVLSCLPALARTSHDIHGGNCVAYARDLTGVHLDGNAAAWWPHAEGRYERGHKPEIGAILVFKPYGRMHVGHVAVVSRVVSAREVLVDQANWVRGRVTKAISVVDASPLNDWTSVKVQYAGTHGRENPTYGFIYPHALPTDFAEASAVAAEPEKHRAVHTDHAAAHARRHKHDGDEQDVASAEEPAPAAHHVAAHTRHHKDGGDLTASDNPAPATQHVAVRTTHHKDRVAQDEAKADADAPLRQVASAAPSHHVHRAKPVYVLY